MQPVPEQFSKPPQVRGGERRQRARHTPAALTYVNLGESNGGIIANISETGMFVTAGEPLRENFLSRVSFRVPQSDAAIEAQGEVVWTSESKKEAGVRFVDLPEESRELIRKWVAPARRNGNPIARPAESPRDGEKRATLTPAQAYADESASAAAAVKSNGGTSGVEPREPIGGITPEPVVPREPPPIPTAVARGIAVSEKEAAPLLAFTGYGPRAWALTEAQRAEFERLFPSENAGRAGRDSAEPEDASAAKPEPIPERFAISAATGFVTPSAEIPHEDFAAAATDTAPAAPPVVEPEVTIEREPAEVLPVARAIPPAAVPRTPMQSLWDAPPMVESAQDVVRPAPEEAPTSRATSTAATFSGAVPRTPVQSLWDAPPPMMHPIIGGSYGGGFGSRYGAPTAEPLEDGRPRSMWSVAAVTILVVAACFVLGFVVGPDGLRAWPKVNAARGVVAGELSHLKSIVTNSGGAASPNAATAPAVSSNPAPSGQNSPPSASPTPPASTAAPATGAPALDAPGSGAPVVAAPAAPAPSATTPAAENSAPDENASGANAAPTDSDGTGDEADTAPTAGPAPNRTERPAAKKRDLERAEAKSSRAAREAQIERERAAAEAYAEERAVEDRAAASARHGTAQPTTPAVTAETAKPAMRSPSRTEAPSTLAARPTEAAPHPAVTTMAPRESYFPVVAPGAGNVPRLIELPEERVIDTAAVVIHSHQYVFVPAEPGPESSHALEKLRIGDRITKMAPMYPAEAARKAMGGTVHLRATIGKDGKVEDVRPINGPLTLITAAADAIQQWRYRPTLLDQQPIEVQEDLTIEFRPLGLH